MHVHVLLAGHRLGNRDTTEYSNLSEPAFHSAGAGGSGSTGSTQQLSGSLNSFTLPHTPVSTQTPNSAHTTNAAPLNNTPPQSPIPLQLSQPEPTQLPSTTTLPTQPPSVPSQPVTLSPSPSLAHSSSTDSVTEQNFKPPAATADSDNVLSVRGTSLNPPKPVFSHPAHTLTEGTCTYIYIVNVYVDVQRVTCTLLMHHDLPCDPNLSLLQSLYFLKFSPRIWQSMLRIWQSMLRIWQSMH